MSQISHTTVGGGTLEEVVRGKKTYVAQKECLIDLRNEEDIDVVKQKLLCHCEEICTHLEENSLRTINKFYIGKALITQRRKPRGKGFIKFDPMDPNTWKKNGISSRWGTHKKEDYGRDGMIVLTAITKEAVLHRHQGNKKSLPHQEQYGLALEQMLQHHYKLKKNDPRFANNTFTSGGSDKGKSIAYAVYIAFSLSDHDEETTMEGVSNPQQLASDEDSSISAMNDPSQTSTQEPNVMSTSESLFSPTYVSRNKRPRTEPHPPGTKRRHQESGQDANMSKKLVCLASPSHRDSSSFM